MAFKNKEAEREYHQNYYRKKRAEAITQLGGKCVRCGGTKCLEFDHIDPATKTAVVSTLVRKNSTRLQSELRKCQLLCHDCHTRKSISDTGKRPAKGTHGTLSSRRYCACRKCVAAKTLYMRTYKRRKRSEKRVKKVAGTS